MRPTRASRRGRILATSALVVSVSTCFLALWNALVLAPVPTASAEDAPPQATTKVEDGDLSPLDTVLAAVDVDPFSPERRAPQRRFGVSGPEAPPVRGGESLRLTGTALLPGGGAFVLATLGAGSPRIVRVGETLGGYRLTAVREGEADFRVAGENVTFSVLRTGGTPHE